MTLAGKYGIGVLSIGSMATEGITALGTQWGFAEDAALESGSSVDRSDWRSYLTFLAESKDLARSQARRSPTTL